jgi:hypothetical protein
VDNSERIAGNLHDAFGEKHTFSLCTERKSSTVIVWHSDFFPSPSMPTVARSTCAVDGCTNHAHGKAYCHTHMKDKGKSTVITDAERLHMRSDCCEAACIDGPRHDYGKQYCAKCKQACCWHPFKF